MKVLLETSRGTKFDLKDECMVYYNKLVKRESGWKGV